MSKPIRVPIGDGYRPTSGNPTKSTGTNPTNPQKPASPPKKP